ncbi:MAG: bifunctional DNA primase/polymerase, partial [Candidatus Binatus sp.]|uniref:bifunctional DNA primase/polymerase n=1 Tax=Candidatus Binatus sp. TaxID=2811406 RepID=UPI003C706A4D
MPNNISYPSLDLVAPAKQYAAEGFRVFPLKLNSKLPATKNGFKDAVSDPALIEKMFAKHKGNIAITPPPEIFIIDVDVKHGIDGKANLNDLCRKHGGITKTRFQQTPSGGLHLIYRKPADVIVPQSAGKLAPGVDVRTDKGYIVAAPSVIVPWLKPYDMNDHEIAVAPQWLLDLLVNGKPKEVASSERGRIVDGGRNVGLTSYAGSLRNRGRDEEAILEALRIRNEKDCDPPLDDEELRKIAHSVGKYAPDARDGTDATRSLTELGNAYRLA